MKMWHTCYIYSVSVLDLSITSVLLLFVHALYVFILGMGTGMRASCRNEVNQRRWHGSSDDNRYRDSYVYLLYK